MSDETLESAEAAVEKTPAKKTTRKPAAKTATAAKKTTTAAKKKTTSTAAKKATTAAKTTTAKAATAKKTTAAKKTTTAAKRTTAAKKTAESPSAAEEQLTLTPAAEQAPQAADAAQGKDKRTVRRRRAVSSAPADKQAEESKDKPADKDAGKAEDKPAETTETNETAESGEDSEEKDQRDNKRGRRRSRRGRSNHQRKEIVPSATRDELALLEDDDIIVKARELGVDPTEYGERDDLVSAVYDALLQAEGFVMVEGILDLLPDGYGFIRTDGYLPGEHDVYVGVSTVRRQGLRKGDHITGRVRPPRENEKYPALNTIVTLNDEPFEGPTHRVKFAQLTPVYPDERLIMEHGKDALTARAIDLVAPIGKGQRGLIVSPPKAGKTTVLKDIAAAISANNPEIHLMCLLVDERPEEVTDMERSIDGEVISSTFDMPFENHIAVAELVIERAKRLVENGQDVVILLDSITRLARAYNLSQPASGRILSGGVDSTALYPPKRFLGAARNIEFGGSLTILGTALIDTGSKMDEVIFEEFKGTGNMELKLDRALADRRIFPAIDPVASGTRKEELLIDPQEAPLVRGVRSLLANMNNTERAMKMLVQSLKATETNREFLVKSARKASKAAASL
jgi:transcription termination factor Rho